MSGNDDRRYNRRERTSSARRSSCGRSSRFHPFIDFLGTAKRLLHILADILGPNNLLELCLMDQLRGLFTGSAKDYVRLVACSWLAISSSANKPVASSAVILRKRRITTGGNL